MAALIGRNVQVVSAALFCATCAFLACVCLCKQVPSPKMKHFRVCVWLGLWMSFHVVALAKGELGCHVLLACLNRELFSC